LRSKIAIALLIISIAISISDGTNSIGITRTQYPTEIHVVDGGQISPDGSDGSDVHDSSKNIFELPDEAPPVNIIREIVEPKRGKEIFRNETAEVLIKITTQKKDGLKQIEFWELPEKNLELNRCSYQIRTADINQMLDYEEHDESILDRYDLIDSKAILIALNNTSVDQPRKELNNYIYKQLSNNTINLSKSISQNRFDNNQDLLGSLLDDLNDIINSNNSTTMSELFAKCNFNVDRKRVDSLNPHSLAYNDMNDYRLQNRLMLEHIFPKMIKNLSFLKDHENQKIIKDKNAIKITEKNLRHGETVLFKYYFRPTKLGSKNIRYIIRADGYFLEGTEPITVSERGEEFSIDYWCDSKDLTRNKPEVFIYKIEYTGGNGEENQFPLYIQPPGGCKITDVSWEEESGSRDDLNMMPNGTWRSKNNVQFSKGIIKKLNLTAVFDVTGLRISPPTIKIGTYPKDFETDLAVYADYDNIFRIHYDFYTVLLTIAAILLSLIVAICSSVELYLAQREINIIHKEIDASNKIISRNNEIFESLKEKLKPP